MVSFLMFSRAEIPVTSTPVDNTADNAATAAGDAANDADLIPALEEARLLAEAVQGHHSHSHSRIEAAESRLPCFFTVSENSNVEIRAAPSNSSQSIRTLKKVRIQLSFVINMTLIHVFYIPRLL